MRLPVCLIFKCLQGIKESNCMIVVIKKLPQPKFGGGVVSVCEFLTR